MIQLKADPRLLTFLVRSEATPDGQHFLSWLKGELARQQHELAHAKDEVNLRQSQGAAQLLEQLLEVAETARATLERIKDKESQRH